MKHLFVEILKKIKNRYLEFNILLKEFRANRKVKRRALKSDLEGKILVITHSIEKGMGIKNTKIGYGKRKADKLLNYLFDYVNGKHDYNIYAFHEAIAVLNEYFRLQESWGEDIQAIKDKYNKLCQMIDLEASDFNKKCKAGHILFCASELKNIERYNFESFVQLRHSIRDYRDEIISKEILEKVVQIANMSPSACNRQASRVYCTKTKEESKYIDSIITGTTGFKGNIPNFAIITEDRAYFSGAEQFQWYINGGIYVAYFTLALHSFGIGNCIMQWFAFYKTEKEIKKFFHISENEAIVAIVGYGYCADEGKCLAAQRKSVQETLFFRE